MKPAIHYQSVNPTELTQRTNPFDQDWLSVSSPGDWETDSDSATGLK
jgi:hypothetical protein